MPEQVFVDTGAWVALSVEDDRHHPRAEAQWRRLMAERRRIVTSNYVIDEAITTVRGLAGHAKAVELGERLFSTRLVRRVRVDEGLEERAWALFKSYEDQTLSFTDCTSFAVMGAERIKKVFTFDTDFLIAGCQLLPPPE